MLFNVHLRKRQEYMKTAFLCSDAERERVKVTEILTTTVNIRTEKSNYLTIRENEHKAVKADNL